MVTVKMSSEAMRITREMELESWRTDRQCAGGCGCGKKWVEENVEERGTGQRARHVHYMSVT